MKELKIEEEMKEIEKIIGIILRVGVFISCLFMFLGLFLFFVTGQSGYSGDFYPTKLGEIIAGSFLLKPVALLMLGLLLLIFTPVLRVFVSIVSFFIEKDYLYVKITVFVLVILMVSLFIGLKS